jgi:hypothetical protein
MELSSDARALADAFQRLRTKLGLPPVEDLSTEGVDVATIPACRLHRLPPEKLGEEALVEGFERASFLRFSQACHRFGEEILGRESLRSRVDEASVYATLSITSSDADEALSLIQQAQQAATKAGRSPAPFLLHELQLRTARGEAGECQRLFQLLQSRHTKEPGVGEALYRWLVEVGAVTPEGKPKQPAAPAESPEAVGGAAQAGPERPGGLWTPDQPESPGEKQDSSGLWLPGQ